MGCPDGRGRINHFQGGSIYWAPSTGAHEVHGGIRDLWASMGRETSFLGYPATDGIGTGDRSSRFQSGHIGWSPAQGAVAHGSTLVD